MTAVPFDWSPSATPEPGEQRAVVTDEGDVGGAAHPDEARLCARIPDAPADRRQDLRMRKVVDRRLQAVAEGRPDRDHDLVGPLSGASLARLDDDGRACHVAVHQLARVDDVRQRLAGAPSARLRAGTRCRAPNSDSGR